MSEPKATTVELTDWELQQITMWAAGNALAHLGHYSHAGLINQHEVDQMNNWMRLAAKLRGDPVPEDLPFKGRNRR